MDLNMNGDGCYWIYISKEMARRDCDRHIFYLKKDMIGNLPENKMLQPYVGTLCPMCGRKIFIDEHSYDLLLNS